MMLWFHRLVQRDVNQIIAHYEAKSGSKLADEFYSELMAFVREAAENPHKFRPYKAGLRRANLHRFPCHFLYQARKDGIDVLVVRHHRRRSGYGMRRR